MFKRKGKNMSEAAELMHLHETLEYGQGYDDDIVEILKSFQKFRDGYYELINNGDEWWDVFNQGIEFQEIMKKAWEEIEDADIMGNLEKMAIAIAGGYIRFDKFVDGVIQAYEDGCGFRHKESEE